MILKLFHHTVVCLDQEFLVGVVVQGGCMLSVPWFSMWGYVQFQPHDVEVDFPLVDCNRVLVLFKTG